MAPGPVAGCWVFLAGHNARSRSIQIEKKAKGERGRGAVPLPIAHLPLHPFGTAAPPPCAAYPRRYHLVTPARIFKLQPFRNVKGDFCRTPSIEFNGHRYSNLFDGALPLPSAPPCPPFGRPSALLSSTPLSLSLSAFTLAFRVLPVTKTVTVTGASYPRVGRGERGKKEFAFRLFLFSSSDRRYSRADLERKPRRQMRASARGNCLSSSSSSIFRAAYSPRRMVWISLSR